jgi:hypothetical protein
VPSAKQQSRGRSLEQPRCVARLSLSKPDAEFTLHEGLSVQRAIAEYRVINAVRRLEGRDLGDASQARFAEIDRYVGEPNRPFAQSAEQRFLKPIGLALNAVNEHAPSFAAIQAPPLEDVPRSLPTPFLWICRRKNFVVLSADWLQDLLPAQRGVPFNGVGEFCVVHLSNPSLRLPWT